MNEDIRMLWESIFGKAWETLTKSVSEVSAFLLDHRTKSCFTDGNMTNVLENSHNPSYDSLMLILMGSGETAPESRRFKVVVFESNEDHTAGYIFRSASIYDIYSELPLCPYPEFAAAVAEQSSLPSLLAIMRLEKNDSSDISINDLTNAHSAIRSALTDDSLIASAGKMRFWIFVPNFERNKHHFLRGIQKALRTACPGLTFSAGCGADNVSPAQRMKTAEITLFDAVKSGKGVIGLYSDKDFAQRESEYDNMMRFTKLIDENLFIYNFQPIISASTGEIIAYEALMRTDKTINMYPLEILDAASRLGRLYDIEKATMKNTLNYISRNQSVFKNKKLFVNSIPTHMLSRNDWDSLVQEYGELMEKVVIEMTEQSEIDGGMLNSVLERLDSSNMQIAIDDYGTGYSNASNLLRYKPKCVKIDRSLVSNIDIKPSVQKLVSVLIEFCHDNGFDVLAEGVETKNELKMMIKLGVDLIQGYYISRPKPFTMDEISDELKYEIAHLSAKYSRKTSKVYKPRNSEKVSLEKITAEGFSAIIAVAGTDSFSIEGISGKSYPLTVSFDDDVCCEMTMRDAMLASDKVVPCIAIGGNCDIRLEVKGTSGCSGKLGIFVPETSMLEIFGNGKLNVISEEITAFGIGSDPDHSHGRITLSGPGDVFVTVNGEKAIGIGGGQSSEGGEVRINGGGATIRCSGDKCIAIGDFNGGSRIGLKGCNIDIQTFSPYSVGIGALTGSTDLNASNYRINISMSGVNLCAVGAMENGEGCIVMNSGSLSCDMHGNTINCVGTTNGRLGIKMDCSTFNFDCEGSKAIGVGDATGQGDIRIHDCELNIKFSAKDAFAYTEGNGSRDIYNCLEDIHIND